MFSFVSVCPQGGSLLVESPTSPLEGPWLPLVWYPKPQPASQTPACLPSQVPTCSTWTSLYRGTHQPCSNLFSFDLTVPDIFKLAHLAPQRTGPLPPRICWNFSVMKHVRSAIGRLASYWNAFLFVQCWRGRADKSIITCRDCQLNGEVFIRVKRGFSTLPGPWMMTMVLGKFSLMWNCHAKCLSIIWLFPSVVSVFLFRRVKRK